MILEDHALATWPYAQPIEYSLAGGFAVNFIRSRSFLQS